MTFIELVHNRLDGIFEKHNLQCEEEFENYIKLKSNKVIISLSYDERENGGCLYVGKTKTSLLYMGGGIINKFFPEDLKKYFIVPEKTKEDFVNNIFSLFNNKGKLLIEGDQITLDIISRYLIRQNENYTNTLLQEQHLLSANKAWSKRDYKSFIDYIDKTNWQTLQPLLSFEI